MAIIELMHGGFLPLISMAMSILSGSFHSGNTCLLQKLIIILLE